MMKYFIALSTMLIAGWAQAQSLGALQVNGQPGKYQIFQKVKAVRCTGQRGACDNPVFFDLNKAKEVPAGTYLVGFENSIYPEPVQVEAGRTQTLTLERVSVPSSVRGDRIRVFRDFSSLVEQRKIYLTVLMMNRHFFRLDKDNFGDLYLTGSWDRDFVQRFSYDTCSRMSYYPEAPAAAKSICKSWSEAKKSDDLRELFEFADDGTFQEMWVTFPGDISKVKHPRYLVSTPMSQADFVSVFPGTYKFQAEGKGKPAVSVKVGNVTQTTSVYGISLNAIQSLSNLVSGESCTSARIWMTASRAYCTRDSMEGCDRSSESSCVPMQ